MSVAKKRGAVKYNNDKKDITTIVPEIQEMASEEKV